MTHPQGVGQRALHELHRQGLALEAEEGAGDVQTEHHAVALVEEEDLLVCVGTDGGYAKIRIPK
jgi:hypothetical protein